MVCDAALGVFARVLEELPASAKGNFRALVIGLDPNDTPAIAQQARNRHFEPDRSAAKDPAFLVGSANAVKRLAKAVGYRYAYDPERGEFAHPVIVIVVDADKRITRYLPLLGMSGTDLQLALNDAGAPATGFAQAVRALCYRFDPATGLYTPAIETILTVACGATVAAMLVGFALLRSRTRQSSLSDAGGKRG